MLRNFKYIKSYSIKAKSNPNDYVKQFKVNVLDMQGIRYFVLVFADSSSH